MARRVCYGRVDESVSQSVSERRTGMYFTPIRLDLLHEQPIKLLVVKVNDMWEDLIPIQFFYKRGGSIHILGLFQNFLWVTLRILVMDKISLEVWNSMQDSCMQTKQDTFIFSYKERVWMFTIIVSGGNNCFVLVEWSNLLCSCWMEWLALFLLNGVTSPGLPQSWFL